jgi:opacity protein-like surface antigen
MKRAVVFLLLAALAVPASAAVVHLKDGSRVRGTVVSATARDVRVHTENGTLNIEADKISRIDYDEKEAEPERSAPEQVRYRPRAAEPERRSTGEAPQMFSINFGFSNPLSRVDFSSTGGGSGDNGDTGFVLGAQYAYYVTRRLAVGMNLEFMNRGQTNSHSLLPSANTDVFGNTMLVMPVLRYSLTSEGTARPYLLAGIGSNRTSTIIESTPDAGFIWDDTSSAETRTLVDESRWGLATTARFGIDFMLADPALFSVEFGWTGISNSDYAATRAGQDLGLEKVTGDLNILTIAARWGWRF